MFSSIKKKWNEIQFEASLEARVKRAKLVIEEYDGVTDDDIDYINQKFAKSIVLRNLGKEDLGQIEWVTNKVEQARKELENMFLQDGYDKELSRAISFICIGWDQQTYEKNKLNNNMTLNCLLKVHTMFNGLYSEKDLLKR
ncbi:hypothetical protein [Thalassotalea sp. G2M2-11]|uniref:hypothetical protein n=1 Tax=Thalassotalea sp. G2M2-11 TaxID=2787627 RepID=UPI0019CFCAF8|nr:hypothetical protein [Thalassotalea sp. G2M2-11]